MLVSALSVVICAASLTAPSANALDVGNAVKRATDFTFDLFSGLSLQEETSAKSRSELEYTTGGGVP